MVCIEMPRDVAKGRFRQGVRYIWRRFDTARGRFKDDSRDRSRRPRVGARVPEPRDGRRRFEDDPIGFPAQTSLSAVPEEIWPHARVLPLLSLSYPNAHGARDLPDQAERTEGQGAYSDVIRSAFRRHSISVPKVSDQDSGAIRSAFRSFDQPFRAFDQSRPSG